LGAFDLTRERLERWVADPDPAATLFGMEQDEDLLLGAPENVPLLCEYLDRREVPMGRRTLLVLAMAEMLMLERTPDGVTHELAETIAAALLRNRDAVVASYDGVVGVPAELMLRRLLGQPTLSYEQGRDATTLVATPTPERAEWAAYVDRALEELASSRRVEFPAGRHHFGGVFAGGIRARYRDRPFSLWCDAPGELTVKHEKLRPSQIPAILFVLECTYALGRD
jgi:hypothetical protein